MGEQLVNIHLLKDIGDMPPITRFEGKGDGIVEKVEYKRGKIFINESQYFEDVSSSTWNYYIGGYQVLSKWLRDRKGRKLDMEEIKLYCNIVGAVEETKELQAKIDKVFNEIEEED